METTEMKYPDLSGADSLTVAKRIVRVLFDKLAKDIKLIYAAGTTVLTDYYVVAYARSATHCRALATELEQNLSASGVITKHPEGFENGEWICAPGNSTGSFVVTTADGPVRIVTLTRQDSLRFSKVTIHGRDHAFLSDGTLLWDGKKLRIESPEPAVTVMAYPADVLKDGRGTPARQDVFEGYTMTRPAVSLPVEVTALSPSRYILKLPAEKLAGHKRVELRIDYAGDIGHLFLNGELIADHFCNGDTWVTRIDPWAEALAAEDLTLYITPVRKNATIHVDSPMAARFESAEDTVAHLDSIRLVTVEEWVIA